MLWGSRTFSVAEHENALAEHELVEDLSVRHACHKLAKVRALLDLLYETQDIEYS